ncbi:MAG: hypothetical protein C4293_20980, partial [Nitrospiraceae bacterium]
MKGFSGFKPGRHRSFARSPPAVAGARTEASVGRLTIASGGGAGWEGEPGIVFGIFGLICDDEGVDTDSDALP